MNIETMLIVAAIIAGALITAPVVLAADGQGLQRLGPHEFGWLAADDRSANSAVFVGDDAALVVDPGLTPGIAEDFLKQVRAAIGDLPIRYLLLTHWHPDHALGALCADTSGMQLIAHPFTAMRLREQGPAIIAEFAKRATTEAEKKAFTSCTPRFPEHLIADTESIDLGGVSVEIMHPGHAHTAGDLVAWSASDRVLVTGDILLHAASPDMGEADLLSWVKILDDLVALQPLRAVAGHFGPSSGADLVRFRDYMQSLVSQVEQGMALGLTEDALIDGLKLEEFADFAQYPQYNATFAGNARDVVKALKQVSH